MTETTHYRLIWNSFFSNSIYLNYKFTVRKAVIANYHQRVQSFYKYRRVGL